MSSPQIGGHLRPAGLNSWTPDDDGVSIKSVETPELWEQFRELYAPSQNSVRRECPQLDRVIEIAQDHEVVNLLIETRYIDRDWRSEHAAYYGSTFYRWPTVAHRVHFFSTQVPPEVTGLDALQPHYRGYTILRPLPYAPVGRTMITPPPDLWTQDDQVVYRVESKETVDVLGYPLTVRAMPFTSQDGQYLRCAHSVLWMTMFHSFLTHGMPRQLPADIYQAAKGGAVVDRELPSEGLSTPQMIAALADMGVAANHLRLPTTRTDDLTLKSKAHKLHAIVCRQVNSNWPAMIVSENHTWLVTAYKKQRSAGSNSVTLYCHDDAAGPYLPINSPWVADAPKHSKKSEETDTPTRIGSSWRSGMMPIPPKFYMTAERAEARVRLLFGNYIDNSDEQHPLVAADRVKQLKYRTFGVRTRDFKHALASRARVDPVFADLIRQANLPYFLWVVEAYRADVAPTEPDVIAQVLIDPTRMRFPTTVDPGYVLVQMPGEVKSLGPEYGTESEAKIDNRLLPSGRPPDGPAVERAADGETPAIRSQ